MAGRAGGDVLDLLAPLSGIIVPLERVPDETFARRLAGDGVSIDPMSERVLAPCDARVRQVHRAAHALTLDARGLEIIVHVGLDTVKLRGEGFRALVKAGDQVRAGDPLLAFDADLVARRARSLLTQVVVANMERVAAIEPGEGRVTAGRDLLMRVTLAGAAAVADTSLEEPGATVESEPIVVRSAVGLHARPAALLAAAARRFEADVRITKATREANARSVVSLMALEAAGGDTVRVIARGADAQAAVAEISRLLATDMDAGAKEPLSALGAATGMRDPGSGMRATTARRPNPQSASPIPPLAESTLIGIPASPGVAIGQVFQLRLDDTLPETRAADSAHERRALDTAIGAARAELDALQARLAGEAGADRAAIFAAHAELLGDPELFDHAIVEIDAGASAASAWREAYLTQAERLAALGSPLLAGRAVDLRDVGRRVLRLLLGAEAAPVPVPPDSIVVAEELSPSDTASLDRARVRGFCTTGGGATSHAAIIARGLGIPAVAGIDPRALDLAPGTRVVLDGDAGLLRPAPSATEEAEIARRQASDERRRAGELAAARQPATTRDGHRVEVVANIGGEHEAARVAEVGAEGVGLLRTEFLFMDRREAPDEDEQARAYEAIARALGPERILVVRTLDVGGDKPLPYVDVGAEANPFLGERGVRLTLARPELFATQVRAILRASRAGRVAVMFPMISTLAEWRAARALVERERVALGVPAIQVGIMVETAAAALLAERFARDADFFSVGTNDLTQYTLAMDRGNPRLASQLDALHPAVLRLIECTVTGAKEHGRWVGVCGALAGDLDAIPVLLGLGVRELSADLPIVPAVKARIRTLSLADCRATAREALEAADGAEVRAIVAKRHG